MAPLSRYPYSVPKNRSLGVYDSQSIMNGSLLWELDGICKNEAESLELDESYPFIFHALLLFACQELFIVSLLLEEVQAQLSA